MTDNPPPDRPLALGDLAHADSPEIVRAALGRFRRRLFLRGTIVALIAASGVLLYPRYFPSDNDLVHEIEHGRGVTLVKIVASDRVEATIFRVARLPGQEFPGPRERFGIHLSLRGLILKPGEQLVVGLVPDGRTILEVQTARGERLGDNTEVWISAAAGTRTIDIPVAALVRVGSTFSLSHQSLGTLRIDMERLDVPASLWR